MRQVSSIAVLAIAALLCSCQSSKDAQGLGNAERREAARRAAAQQQSPTDESEANLTRAQQNVVNRDGNAGRYLSGY